MGVGYDEFWYFTPKDLQPFVKAFSLRQKLQDELMWTQGRYIQLAIASSLSNSVKYPNKPFGTKESAHTTTNSIKEKFLARAQVLNSRFKEG